MVSSNAVLLRDYSSEIFISIVDRRSTQSSLQGKSCFFWAFFFSCFLNRFFILLSRCTTITKGQIFKSILSSLFMSVSLKIKGKCFLLALRMSTLSPEMVDTIVELLQGIQEKCKFRLKYLLIYRLLFIRLLPYWIFSSCIKSSSLFEKIEAVRQTYCSLPHLVLSRHITDIKNKITHIKLESKLELEIGIMSLPTTNDCWSHVVNNPLTSWLV